MFTMKIIIRYTTKHLEGGTIETRRGKRRGKQAGKTRG
jgi:hypothetical protein